MPPESNAKPPLFSTQATCSISVEGWLDQRWSDRLAGMKIKTTTMNMRSPVTVLSGRLTDQAELIGVLNTLYNMRLTLIAVQFEGVPMALK